MSRLFDQSVKLCQRAGMVSLVHVAVDGTKIGASANKRKAMSYGRMVEEEARLQAEIDGYFQRATEEDARDDAAFGIDNSGTQVPHDIKRRQSRMAKIREAKAALEAEAQAAAEARRQEREAQEAAADKALPGKKPNLDPTPKDKAQRCFTDPESRIMKGGDGNFLQGYNAQASADGDHQVVVACALAEDANDKHLLTPLAAQTVEQTAFKPHTVAADPGYYGEENIAAMDAMGIAVFVSPDRGCCGSPSDPAPELSAEEMAVLSTKERMLRQVSTETGRDAYRRRKSIIEPETAQRFGLTLRLCGQSGFPRFSASRVVQVR